MSDCAVPVKADRLQLACDRYQDETGYHLLTQDQNGMLHYALQTNTYMLINLDMFITIRDYL